MQMSFTYGIFDHEADHIVDLVRRNASLDHILSIPCPACGAKINISFHEAGTEFTISCEGDPLHMTEGQDIATPPSWWRSCYEEPTDITWYWREAHSFGDAGTLVMTISGWDADGTRWSGGMEWTVDHPDYDLWQWILNESNCTKDLISDTDLESLRAVYSSAR